MQTDIRHHNSEIRWVIVVSALVVVLASLPYVAVYSSTPRDLRFVGILINPFDGNSYLAKMQIGAQGGWLFHLLYTAEDHPGALLFSFHILLGHVAAWTRLPIPLVYHLSRVSAGFVLLWVVYALIARATQDLAERRLAFLFAGLSSGLGWLAVLLGHLGTSDLLIPESNTFFSLHINPHFPMATALMVGMMLVAQGQRPEAGSRQSEFRQGGQVRGDGDDGDVTCSGYRAAFRGGDCVCSPGRLSVLALVARWAHCMACGVEDIWRRRDDVAAVGLYRVGHTG
jgi:hypothetical protein